MYSFIEILDTIQVGDELRNIKLINIIDSIRKLDQEVRRNAIRKKKSESCKRNYDIIRTSFERLWSSNQYAGDD